MQSRIHLRPTKLSVLTVLVSLIESLPEPVLLFDDDFNIVGVNDAYARIFNQQASMMVGQKCYQVLHQTDAPCEKNGKPCPLRLAQGSGLRTEETQMQSSSDGLRRVRVELIPLKPDSTGKQYFLNRIHRLPTIPDSSYHGLVGQSVVFRQMISLVERVATAMTSVLLLGESGTGKELVAQTIHDLSGRKDKNFVAIDCSGLPETLFESELFGHERGAFTGATSARIGLLEAANGGTLFIDEVGDIPLNLQVKLLRFIETGTYRRLGSTVMRHANVRLISATHQPLLELVEHKKFRQDLYYRLNAFPIHLPNLKSRIDDIPILATVLLGRISEREQKDFYIDPDAINALKSIDFKGNIRELRNVLERAAILCGSQMIEQIHIHEALQLEGAHLHGFVSDYSGSSSGSQSIHAIPYIEENHAKPLKALEEELLMNMLNNHQGNKKQLALALGISERTLYRKLNKLT